MSENSLTRFIKRKTHRPSSNFIALSIFSGAGLSDIGYELAGFSFKVQCELDKHRAALGIRNFPNSKWVLGDIKDSHNRIIREYFAKVGEQRPALLCLTPPCQGMSSSNPGRGKISVAHDNSHRNALLLESIPVIKVLKPRIIVAENVAQLLNRIIISYGKTKTILQMFSDALSDYQMFVGVVEMADYGIPQMRRRSIIVAIRNDEPIVERLVTQKLLPWPRPTHAQVPTSERKKWITIKDWFEEMIYPALDARTHPFDENLALHKVVEYKTDDYRYELVSGIEPNSGKNAYENSVCPSCKKNSIPLHRAYCPHCGKVLFNRPVTRTNGRGKWRLIRGFDSSYRRASPDHPAPTITTNTSHLGSDNKIHPWENRVLSILECADLQTVPRFYDWNWALETKHSYVIRNAIGEALPPYFTYLHGHILRVLLAGHLPESKLSRIEYDGQARRIDTDRISADER